MSDETATREHDPEGTIASVTFLGWLGLLMFGPVAFGAVESWSILILEMGSTALLILWLANEVRRDALIFRYNPLFLPAACFGLLVFAQVGLRWSTYPYATWVEAQKYVAYGALLLLAVQLLVTAERTMLALKALAGFGALLAFLSLVQSLSWNGKILWLRTPRAAGLVYGPYVNHNHYAGLMEMLWPIPLLLAFDESRNSAQRLLIGLGAVLMSATIFLSRSRGGMIAFVVQIAILLFALRRRSRRLKGILIAALVIMSFAAWINYRGVATSLGTLRTPSAPSVSGNRVAILKDSLQMVRVHPLLGWGLDVFPTAYPRFRSFYTDFFVNEAHNDYLQVLVETGLVGFGLVLWFLVVWWRRAWHNLRHSADSTARRATLAALIGCCGLLTHSFLDFNLHIPANAALFYVLCGIAAQKTESRNLSQPTRRRSGRSSPVEITEARVGVSTVEKDF
jgi:O-antigen ligase